MKIIARDRHAGRMSLDQSEVSFLLPGSRQNYNRSSITRVDRKRHTSADQGLYSGLIRLHILHHACDEAIFGLGMIEELARHGYRLSPCTLYPIMHGLENKGLLRSKPQQVNSKIRRVYSATPSGPKALKAAKHRVRELFGELFERKKETTKA